VLSPWVQFLVTGFVISGFFGGELRARAETFIQAGSGLQILTQIQGNWSNECRRAGIKPGEGYRRDYLSIGYTYFEFLAKIYTDENCKQLVTQWPAKFRFTLGDQVLLPNHEKVILLNLIEDLDSADAWSLSQNNILHYTSGRLALGRESLLGAGSNQLTSLDLEQSYTRR
jgi:hypothetical protein